MNSISSFFKNKTNRILLVILLIGILLIVLPLLTSKPQCSGQASESGCIIGADIGSGMIWLLGIFVTSISVIGLCIKFIAAMPSKLSRLAVGLILIGAFLLIIGYITAPLLNSGEIYKTAKCSADDGSSIEKVNKEYCEFPKRSPQAVINYSNNKVVAGAALLIGGITISAYSLLKRSAV